MNYGGEVGVQLRVAAELTGVWWVNPHFFPATGQPANQGVVVIAAFAARHIGDHSRAIGRFENRAYQNARVQHGPRFPDQANVWPSAMNNHPR